MKYEKKKRDEDSILNEAKFKIKTSPLRKRFIVFIFDGKLNMNEKNTWANCFITTERSEGVLFECIG